MKQSVLGQRRAVAIQSIAERILNLTGDDIDLVSGLKGNSEHRQLFMLERIAEKLKTVKMPDPVELQPILLESGFDLNSLLELEGMSKTSQKVLAAYFGQLESEQEPSEDGSSD